MKVVLFCGGLGMRMREYSDQIPKPMVRIGYRPILWHVMKYYAHWGHREFVLCLGYRADAIKEYFLNYSECLSNDFVLKDGGRSVELVNKDLEDWRITFVDTGVRANIGERLKAVEPHVRGDGEFLANYSDGLTDFPLPRLIEQHRSRGSLGTFLCVKPTHSFHVVRLNNDDRVDAISHVRDSDVWINGGYFMLNDEIFDHMRQGDELVEAPFSRLINQGKLGAVRYQGFWTSMDTFKDKQTLDDMYAGEEAPWQVWKRPQATEASAIEQARVVVENGTAKCASERIEQ